MGGFKAAITAGIMLSMVCGASPAIAWDGVKVGKIAELHTTDGENFGLRVIMEDATPLCGTSATWGYMNRSFDNYDATAALLTSAFLSGRRVGLHLTAVGSYCRIDYVIFYAS